MIVLTVVTVVTVVTEVFPELSGWRRRDSAFYWMMFISVLVTH